MATSPASATDGASEPVVAVWGPADAQRVCAWINAVVMRHVRALCHTVDQRIIALQGSCLGEWRRALGDTTLLWRLLVMPSVATTGLAAVLGLLVVWPAAPATPTLGGDQASLAGATYHVRVDGGDPTRCTGLVDAADPGVGAAPPCAWATERLVRRRATRRHRSTA
jgi:hypothetical protein